MRSVALIEMILTAGKSLGQTLQTPPAFWAPMPRRESFSKVFQAIPYFSMMFAVPAIAAQRGGRTPAF